MRVSVFGNPDVKEDSLAVRLVPRLKKKFSKMEFVVEDPAEGLKPPEDDLWVILDVAVGLKGVRVLDGVEKLESIRRASVHDYDLAMELKLLKKLGKLKNLKIIAVPVGMEEAKALEAVEKVIASLS